MAMTKKQAAQRILDSMESESRRKSRTIISLIPALITIAKYYSLQVAIGCLLLLLAIIQFSHERMGKDIEESKNAAFNSLGWETEELTENLISKLNKIIQK